MWDPIIHHIRDGIPQISSLLRILKNVQFLAAKSGSLIARHHMRMASQLMRKIHLAYSLFQTSQKAGPILFALFVLTRMKSFHLKLQLINRVANNLVWKTAKNLTPQMSQRSLTKQDHVLVILTRETKRSLLKILSCLSTKIKIRYSQEFQLWIYSKLMIQRIAQLPIVVWDNRTVNLNTTMVFLWIKNLHMESSPSITSQLAGAILYVWSARTKMKSFLLELKLLREIA